MDKLKFPKIKISLSRSRELSVEDYLGFVLMNLRLIDREEVRRQKIAQRVNARFVLKN